MTSNVKLSGLKAITICALLSMTAGLALADDNTVKAADILHALRPAAKTRGLTMGAPAIDPAVKAKEVAFIDTVRNRKTRSLSSGEREEIADIASTKPKIDLEIHFDFNSADISRSSTDAVQQLGQALSDPSLQGSTFVVAGHTDGVGGDAFNQDLSERRADTIKRYLVQNYHIAAANLITVGYGKTKLKDTQDPTDAINRRVQVINTEANTTASNSN
jgi:outer membrane protein OmpA-like peptidoglycan-associated protein